MEQIWYNGPGKSSNRYLYPFGWHVAPVVGTTD